MNKIIIIGIMLMLLVFVVGCTDTSTQESSPEAVSSKEIINQEFNIPLLIGKSPIEIKEILGEPTSKYEPTKEQREMFDMETSITYTKNRFELQMDYLDNKITKMFLCVTSGMKDFNDFLKAGNLKNGEDTYSLRGVKALVEPTEYTCVEVLFVE